MYTKLLLSMDGGIIIPDNQFEQENAAVLAIGLGGTGKDCLKMLKTKIYYQLKPDNEKATVPEYNHIKFLAVDADDTNLVSRRKTNKDSEEDIEISRLDKATEFFDLSTVNVSQLFAKGYGQDSESYRDWLEKIDASAIGAGAGGVRQIGRFVLMENASKFVTTIKRLINEAKTGLTNPDVYVHIFTGLGGGTGSGTFLDACYLIREALKEEKNTVNTIGYFFLPDVNLSRTDIGEKTKDYIKINGYSALQELNYCMDFDHNGGEWSQVYNNIGPVTTPQPPVDLAHLISATDENGNVIPNAYNYSMNVVTDYFLDFVAKSEDQDFSLKSLIKNFKATGTQVKKSRGALYSYCILGGSSAVLPEKEAITYLSSKIFGKFASINKNYPSESGVQEFMKVVQMGTVDSILDQLKEGVDRDFDIEADANDVLTHQIDLEKKYNELLANTSGKLDENSKAMTEVLSIPYSIKLGNDENSQNKVKSLIGRIFKQLYVVYLNPEQGPFYAADLIKSSTQNKTVLNIIDGYLTTINERKANLLGSTVSDDGSSNMENDNNWLIRSRSEFEKSNILNRKSKYNNYYSAVKAVALDQANLASFTKMADILQTLKDQLTKLSDEFTSKFKNVMDELILTFKNNDEYLAVSENTVNESYSIPIMTFDEIKEYLDVYLKQYDNTVDSNRKDFIDMMLSDDGIAAWTSDSKNKVSILVIEFFSVMFRTFANRSMTDYFVDKYKTDDEGALTAKIRDDMMARITQNASPRFSSISEYQLSETELVGYMTVPSGSPLVVNAADSLVKNHLGWAKRPAAMKNRISIYQIAYGVPEFAYSGVQSYEKQSFGSSSVGKHLYEGKQYIKEGKQVTSPKNWKVLPSPTPLSIVEGNPQNYADVLYKNAETAKNIYEMAEKIGIITAGSDKTFYPIQKVAQVFYDDAQAVYAKASNQSADIREGAQGQLKNMRSAIRYEPLQDQRGKVLGIYSDAPTESEEETKRRVRIDHFVQYPKLIELTKQEIEKIDQIDKWIEELQPKKDNEFERFLKAICSGVISYHGALVGYNDKYGEEQVLSRPNMESGYAPVFQAFKTFKTLSEDDKSYIADNSQKVLDIYENDGKELPVEVIEAVKNLQEEFSPDKIKTMVSDAVYKNETVEIKDFIDEIRSDDAGIKSFISHHNQYHQFA